MFCDFTMYGFLKNYCRIFKKVFFVKLESIYIEREEKKEQIFPVYFWNSYKNNASDIF